MPVTCGWGQLAAEEHAAIEPHSHVTRSATRPGISQSGFRDPWAKMRAMPDSLPQLQWQWILPMMRPIVGLRHPAVYLARPTQGHAPRREMKMQ